MNKLFTKIAGLSLGLAMAIGVGVGLGQTKDSEAKGVGPGTDVLFAKGFAGYTDNSFSAAGTDYSAVANNTNHSGVTYALRVFNGSTGAVRGNQSTLASNFNARNTSTYAGYYISSISLTVSGGTIDGSTDSRSIVYFNSSAISPDDLKGTKVAASPSLSGQSTLTWTNTNTSFNYFLLYGLKTSGTAVSTNETNSLRITWAAKSTKLDTPTNLTALQSGSDVTLSWGAVSNVSSYTVKVDGTDTYTGITSTSKTVSGLSQGSHSFTVQAIGNGSTYSDSDVSDSKAFTVTESKTLQSIEIGGTLSKTTYSTTEAWSHSGLTVTAYYDIGDEDVTANASWSYSPATPIFGTTSVSVTASYGGKTNTETYNGISVTKTKLSNPNPVYGNKQITWNNVTNATSYLGYFGDDSSLATTVTSPMDVSQYAGEGAKVFHVKAVGNDTYADSDYATCNFEVPAVVKYQLVTSTDDLVAGCNYIIGNIDKNYFISTTQASNNRTAYALTGSISDNKLVYENGIEIIALGGETGSWTLEATAGTDGALGYLYAAGANSNNYLRTKSESTTWTIEIATDGTATLISSAATRGLMRYNPNNNSPVFACYATTSTTGQAVTIWKEVSTRKTISINKTSISGFKDSKDESLSVTCSNFAPTGINFSYADNGTQESEHIVSSNVVSVSAGSPVDGVYSLTVNMDGVGSTNVKVEVEGATLDPIYFDVTVFAVPSSISVNGENPREIQVGHAIQPNVIVKDSDGATIDGAAWKREIFSADPIDCISLTGDANKTINGLKEGTATIRYTAIVNEQEFSNVYTDVIVNVLEEYIDTVTKVTFNENLTADQGEELTLTKAASIFNEHVGTTHFGKTSTDIALSEFMYSYTNDRDTATEEFYFNQDIDALTNETIYVFHQIDEAFASSFSIAVSPKEVLITSISVNNEGVTGNYESGYVISYNRKLDLEINASVLPATTTQSKDITMSITSQSSSGNATLDGSVLSVGTVIGNQIVVNLVSDANSDIHTTLTVTVVREYQSINVNQPATYKKVISNLLDWSGTYLLVNTDSKVAWTGVDTGKCIADVEISDDEISLKPENAVQLVVSPYSSGYSVQVIGGANTNSYIYGTSGSNKINFAMSLSDTCVTTLEYSEGNVVMTSNNTTMMYNNNTGDSNLRFRYYKSGSSQQAVQLFKLNGGSTTEEIDDNLFNAVVEAEKCFTCNAAGSIGFNKIDEVTLYTWNDVEKCFNSLSNDNKNILKYGVKVENGNEVESFLARYDYIVAKYKGQYADFLGRNPAPIGNTESLLLFNLSTNSSSIIVIAISLLGLASLSGYFYYKKRKEN